MNLRRSFHDLLHRDMNRREFLTHVGMAALAVFGITRLLKALSEDKPMNALTSDQASRYGGGATETPATRKVL